MSDVQYRIVEKSSSKFMIFISYLLFWQRESFMRFYVTTIGSTIYWPASIPHSEGLLQHEIQHVRDHKKYGILFSLSYLLFPLPLLWTMRAHWERKAYRISIEHWVRDNPNETSWIPDFLVDQFCTSRYLWMWPFPSKVRAWANAEIEKAKQSLQN